MNINEWICDLTETKKKKALPILSFPGVQLLGISVKEMISSAQKSASCIKAIADRYNAAAAVSLMDLSVEAEAFGSEVKFSENEVPTVLGKLVKTYEDALSLKVPKVGEARTGICVDAIKTVKTQISDRPVLGGIIGPFSLSGRLMGMTDIMINCYEEPEFVHETLKKAAGFLTSYAKAMKAAGADGILMAEPAAGLLSPRLCAEFSSHYVREIVSETRSEDFIVIYHNCGNTLPLIDSILTIGADAYHFGDAVDMVKMLEKIPSHIPVMGNLSPAEHFLNGTPNSVYDATIKLLERTQSYGNFIPSSGCDIPPQSPIENIDAFFKAVASFYKDL